MNPTNRNPLQPCFFCAVPFHSKTRRLIFCSNACYYAHRKEQRRPEGVWGSKTYRTWSAMKSRCMNPDHKQWDRYGGRGIRVCNRWLTFDGFVADMGEAPPGLTLERSNNNIGYKPGNCVWATHAAQARNRRNTRLTEDLVREIRHSTESSASLARRLKVNPSTISTVRTNKNYWRGVE